MLARSMLARSMLALAIVLTACSVPIDESATVIEPVDLPEPLQPGFTTTTTEQSRPDPDTEQFDVYLLRQPADIEQRAVALVQRALPLDASLMTVIETLFEEPPEFEEGLFSALASENFRLVSATSVAEDGPAEEVEIVAVIDFVVVDLVTDEPAEDQTIDPDLLQDIGAQFVFTTTAHPAGVVAVRILVGGEEVSLPTPDGQTEVGETVTRLDYEAYEP